ncbi:MAG TPA: pyruvate:ferredoxin (flavodoxin) oxidoreductase [Fibrobacteria bacterium]|nr:pyruvate:ferredoxin (flavodoxin) oxidoreductase [Fibrobacteria bacterium]
MSSESDSKMITVDATEAVAMVAHKTNEVIAIYPITPSTPMGEFSDQWSAQKKPNIWGTVPLVMELQSEGGASGTVHGSLQTGALTTTFTCSQGLLLMIPNMYKIAGELTSTVFHVSARSLAAQGLSIYGDHQDVMAVRQTGWAMLASNSVQEAHDFALISQAATLESRVPFVHFFDGFRTSHEINKILPLSDDQIRQFVPADLVAAHRRRGFSSERPFIRGTAQNPDTYFQGRESSNLFYMAIPGIVQKWMDTFAGLTGRQYRLYDYFGAPDADRVVVLMGSAVETAEETAKALNAKGEKVGVLAVRMFRPFDATLFVNAIPASVKRVAVLDRTKEPGSAGEPLYQDVVTAISELGRSFEIVTAGRYGLSSKEFTPAMAKAVFDDLKSPSPKRHFTVGINDDLTHLSLSYDPSFNVEDAKSVRCLFFGVGSDGTVGANKNSIKIIGEETDNHAQGYFFYDSKKSGGLTVSHLRFGPNPIRAPYLIEHASFVACHAESFLEKVEMLKYAAPGAVFLLNTTWNKDQIWAKLPREVQEQIIGKSLKFYVIDAYQVAKDTGMGNRTNTVMQTCFFAISGVLPADEAIAQIKKAIKKTYGKRGEAVVQQNFLAVDKSVENLFQVSCPGHVTADHSRPNPVPASAPEFIQNVIGPMIAFRGDDLAVSAVPVDGTFPSGTTKYEKRNFALEIPDWDPSICIQCNKCAFVCPHAVIRPKLSTPENLAAAPEGFKHVPAKFFKEYPGTEYVLQVSPEDCTGCGICIEACPARDKTNSSRRAINLVPVQSVLDRDKANWDYFLKLPEVDRTTVVPNNVKNSQLLQPLFEFSGACAGCGETPYVKLLTQMFGDRAHIANATGCSSIYGGNLPTTPYTTNAQGRGPAWSNSLFEDNAEFGLGFRLALDQKEGYAKELLKKFSDVLGDELVTAILEADQKTEKGLAEQRLRVELVKSKLATDTSPGARDLVELAETLVKRSVWILGGDGWAYDIGYGGLDHVLSTGRNVNVLVLDTEVYSNTGGQASKSTPIGAVAKFAATGKGFPKKDLGLIAQAYGYVYVARIAMGANDAQTVRAFQEAEAYDGPSLIIAYSHCIAHGFALERGLEQQKLAVQSGHWPLYRYNPELVVAGNNGFQLDSKEPSIELEKYVYNETRYKMLLAQDKPRAEMLLGQAKAGIASRWTQLQYLAAQNKDAN